MFFRKVWGGGFFYELLITTLKRTITGRNDLNIAVSIGQTLSFDMARGVKEALNKTFSAAVGCDRFTHGGFVELDNIAAVTHNLDAATAATECCLDRDG